MEDAFDVLVSL